MKFPMNIVIYPILVVVIFGLDNVYATNQIQVNQFTSVSTKPTLAQREPLLAISEFKFSPKIKTVGQAIHQVLEDTGYSLVSVSKLSSIVQEVLKKPLPVTQRELGPITVSEALKVLIGDDVFYMRIDHLNRLVTFKLKHHSNRHKKKLDILGGNRHG